MGIISWIIFGFIVGLLARAIMPGRDKMGLLATVLLGIGGGVLAGWIGQALGWYPEGSGAGIIASVVGALIVLWIYNKVVSKRSARGVLGRSDKDRYAA
jgi:uncharacterized membrane protein YeaQ/YmgE (transglycosylase-associated protein family)